MLFLLQLLALLSLLLLVLMLLLIGAIVAWAASSKPEADIWRATWQCGLLRAGFLGLGIWFVVGGWWTFRHFLQSPELAKEPYHFLNAARVRKGLPPTPDGLSRDPQEYFREAERRKMHLGTEARADLTRMILARGEPRP